MGVCVRVCAGVCVCVRKGEAPSGHARVRRARAIAHGGHFGSHSAPRACGHTANHLRATPEWLRVHLINSTFGPSPWAPRACGRTARVRARTDDPSGYARVRRVRCGHADSHLRITPEWLRVHLLNGSFEPRPWAPRARGRTRRPLRDTPRAHGEGPSGHSRVSRVRADTREPPSTCAQERRVRAGTHGSTFEPHPTGAACERARTNALSGHAQRRRVRAGTQRIAVGPPQSAPRASGHARDGGRRRVRAGSHERPFGTRPAAPRACGHTENRRRTTSECAACERARTGRGAPLHRNLGAEVE